MVANILANWTRIKGGYEKQFGNGTLLSIIDF